ncbi:MAG TPA: hypothetical protein VK843_10090 [Planctomycetota bacterium]|nr:hypothetical protein [Planctomycetota bacterium]
MHERFLALLRAHTFAGICAAFLIAEVALRAAGYGTEAPVAVPWRYDPSQDGLLLGGDGLHEGSLRELWRPAPGSSVPGQSGERVNAAGYRGPLLAAAGGAQGLRIALLGDGTTFGEGVAFEETYGARLAQLLKQGAAPAEVLDAGVIGFSVEQCFERYLLLVRPSAPDIVVLALCGIEEARPSPMTDRAKIALAIRRANGWSFVSQQPVLDLRTLAWLRDLVLGFNPRPLDSDFLEELGKRRQARLANDSMNSGSPDWPGSRRVPVARFESSLRRFVRRTRADRIGLILLCMPRAPEIDSASSVLAQYDETLRIVGRDEQIDVVDGGAFFAQQIGAGAEPRSLFAAGKLTSEGHTLLSLELARAVLARRGR